MQFAPRRHVELYGLLAFAGVVLACYAQLTFIDLIQTNIRPGQLVGLFALGLGYALLFSFSGVLCDHRAPGLRVAYYVVQLSLVGAALLLSPSRGFFGVLAMPLVGQAIFEFGARGASAVTVAAFAANVGVFALAYGWGGLWRSLLAYVPIYLFVVSFSVLAKQATISKENAERLSRQLAEANEKLRAHAASAEELATTRERNRLAREIHDGVGHYLTVIKVQLDAAAALLPSDPPRATESVQKAARLAADALGDVRRSVSALAADSVRPPLLDTLRQLTSDAMPAPALQIEGSPRALDAVAEHALFRAAQEGLTNVRKHAGATSATLTLDFRLPGRVRLTIADNGRGLPADMARGSGYGLRGLRERIALLGGSVVAGNAPGGGFALTVEVPA
jgi:signal transduction histidine kinase